MIIPTDDAHAHQCVMRSEHASGRKFLPSVDRMIYGDSDNAMVCCKSIKFERYGRRSRHRERSPSSLFCLGFFCLC